MARLGQGRGIKKTYRVHVVGGPWDGLIFWHENIDEGGRSFDYYSRTIKGRYTLAIGGRAWIWTPASPVKLRGLASGSP